MPEEQKREETAPHKRRVRYKGTHPRKFEEKYKELQPEKYAETVQHIIEKGGTPAGMHRPIMVKEILDVLSIKPGEHGLDATLGYGGHTRAMLRALAGSGHLCALDIDPIESAKTVARLRTEGITEAQFGFRLLNFAKIDEAAAEEGLFDFVLADLGVSSMQIDDPSRGFSYKTDGPLDLRLDPMHGERAAERLCGASKEELCGMFMENADEPYAAEIAAAIVKRQKKGPKIKRTAELAAVIEEALSFVPEKERKEAVKKSCQRVFQALRIDVNQEYEVLYAFLEKLPAILKPGGRAAILTFHSGEDRLVKKSLKEGLREGVYASVSEDVIRPSRAECIENSRARSTKLRWAVRA